MKKCKKCGTDRPEQLFHRNKTAPDGRRTVCKICRNKRHPLEEPLTRNIGPERITRVDKFLEKYSNKKLGCSSCGRLLPVSEFNRFSSERAADRFYRQAYCRECQKKARKRAPTSYRTG